MSALEEYIKNQYYPDNFEKAYGQYDPHKVWASVVFAAILIIVVIAIGAIVAVLVTILIENENKVRNKQLLLDAFPGNFRTEDLDDYGDNPTSEIYPPCVTELDIHSYLNNFKWNALYSLSGDTLLFKNHGRAHFKQQGIDYIKLNSSGKADFVEHYPHIVYEKEISPSVLEMVLEKPIPIGYANLKVTVDTSAIPNNAIVERSFTNKITSTNAVSFTHYADMGAQFNPFCIN